MSNGEKEWWRRGGGGEYLDQDLGLKQTEKPFPPPWVPIYHAEFVRLKKRLIRLTYFEERAHSVSHCLEEATKTKKQRKAIQISQAKSARCQGVSYSSKSEGAGRYFRGSHAESFLFLALVACPSFCPRPPLGPGLALPWPERQQGLPRSFQERMPVSNPWRGGDWLPDFFFGFA